MDGSGNNDIPLKAVAKGCRSDFLVRLSSCGLGELDGELPICGFGSAGVTGAVNG